MSARGLVPACVARSGTTAKVRLNSTSEVFEIFHELSSSQIRLVAQYARQELAVVTDLRPAFKHLSVQSHGTIAEVTRRGTPTVGDTVIRKVLSGLSAATEGIGALRTRGGDAHGQEGGHRRIDHRIARLANHAASTVALFLIETWERNMQRSLPADSAD